MKCTSIEIGATRCLGAAPTQRKMHKPKCLPVSGEGPKLWGGVKLGIEGKPPFWGSRLEPSNTFLNFTPFPMGFILGNPSCVGVPCANRSTQKLLRHITPNPPHARQIHMFLSSSTPERAQNVSKRLETRLGTLEKHARTQHKGGGGPPTQCRCPLSFFPRAALLRCRGQSDNQLVPPPPWNFEKKTATRKENSKQQPQHRNTKSADIVRRVGYIREDYWIPKRG